MSQPPLSATNKVLLLGCALDIIGEAIMACDPNDDPALELVLDRAFEQLSSVLIFCKADFMRYNKALMLELGQRVQTELIARKARKMEGLQ